MQAISLRKLLEQPHAGQQTLASMGIVDLQNRFLSDLIHNLNLGSKEPSPLFPASRPQHKHDFISRFGQLRKQGQLADVIGATKPSCDQLHFSTLLSSTPKRYLDTYLQIAETITQEAPGTEFCLWLEDSFTRLYRQWDEAQTSHAAQLYRDYFQQALPNCQITLSSQSGVPGVPESFLDETLGRLTLNDFAELLPFHKRDAELISVLDLVHFSWNCYVVSLLPGMHMVGANTKRHFQLFRKLLGKNGPTVLLVPEQSE